jgi:phosphonate transport system ATP-binding protein
MGGPDTVGVSTPNAVSIEDLSRHFGDVPALSGVGLRVERGEMVALIGASGSGKSTLLRHLAGFMPGDRGSGAVEVLGGRIQHDGRLAPDVRQQRRRIGFVFQQFNLVGRLSVLTNVMTGLLPTLPAWRALTGRFTDAHRLAALEALASVGIAERALQRASTLSGGQQQRAALARALVQGAEVLLADEPVASLDPESSRRVMELLAQLNRDRGMTVLVSLHQVELAMRYCPRTVALRAGRVVYDGPSAGLGRAQLRALYGSEAEELFQDMSFGGEPMPSMVPLPFASAA